MGASTVRAAHERGFEMQNQLAEIVKEIGDVLAGLDQAQLDAFEDALAVPGRNIFVDGEGRSRYAGQCFAMRLMHIGVNSHMVGDTVTPAFGTGDLLISISGSGKTPALVANAEKAKKAGTEVVAITTNVDSPLGKLSDLQLVFNATTRGQLESRASIQLLGSLFDQSVHVGLDGVCLSLSKRMGISNSQATTNHV